MEKQKENNKELKCVWILTHSWADRFGDDADEPKAFMQEENAKHVFNELVDGYKKEKPLFEGVRAKDTVIEEDENENTLDFYAYEEGYAAGNNVHVNLHRCIIED